MQVAEMKVEEVARRWARALEVFSRHGIDACCGGDKSVAEAARLHEIELGRLLEELADAGVPTETVESR